jgi:hypothetical protein
MKKLFCFALLAALSCPWWSAPAVAADPPANKDAANKDAADKDADPEFTITPVVTFADVSGNKSKFREDTWTRDGWTGGVGEFDWSRKIDKDTDFRLNGRGIVDQRDYDIHLDLTKHDFGFVRMGFTQYPKYFDSEGGYYGSFPISTFSLLTDPQLDIGHMTFDAGLTLPDLPKFTFGYERQYKSGSKSMLEWGSVTETVPGSVFPNGATAKKIYPGVKGIDENVDIFKLGVDHSIGSLNLGDNFYFEKYDNATQLLDEEALTSPANTATFRQTNEQFKHDMFSNSYHMDQHLNDKVFWSAGYLFTSMNGGGNYNVNNIYYGVAPGATDPLYKVPWINMNDHSNVGNVNLMVGPFKDLTAYVGMQGEKTHTESFMMGNFATVGTAVDNRVAYTVLDEKSTEEDIGFRYTMIPYTTVYAEARFTQENYGSDQNETDLTTPGGSNTYGAGIGTDTMKQQYKVGFSTSPWARVNVTSQYQHNREENNYGINYLTGGDAIPAVPTTGTWGAGYIRNLTFDTDEVSAKLAVRPCSRVNVTMKYQLVSTSIKSQAINGTVPACQFNQNIYSMSATWTPINRLYLMGLVSYQDTLTTAFDNSSNTVIPYRGNVYSVIGSVGYVLDNKSDVDLQLCYSHSDNFVNNGYVYGPGSLPATQYGLPYMVSDDLTNASIGWKRKIDDHSTVGVRFGFANNREPSSGGVNDYSAYIASVSYTFKF